METRGSPNQDSQCKIWLMSGWWWLGRAPPNHLHPWQIELSCTDGRQTASRPRHHASLDLAGILGWLCPCHALHVADIKLEEAEQRWVQRLGLEQGGGTRRAPAHSIWCLQMTHPWQLSPSACQEKMSCGSNCWRFSFWGSLTAFFNSILSPRFQVQLQTLQCVSPLSAERGLCECRALCVSV